MKRKRNQVTGDDGELRELFLRKRKRSEKRGIGTLSLLIMIALATIGMLAMASYFNAARQVHLPNGVTVTVERSVPTRIIPLESVSQPTLPPEWTAVPTSTPTHTPTVTSTPTATLTPTVTPWVRERVVTIEAQSGWQSGETRVEPGEVIEITYVEGRWLSWPGTGPFGPDGGFFYVCDEEDCVEPLHGYSQAGMIGRIGDEGEMFPVGYRASLVAETGGELQLRINDDYTTDNEGRITMRIVVMRYND